MRLFPFVGLAILVASGCATVQTTRPTEFSTEFCATSGQRMAVYSLGDLNRSAAQQYSNLLAQARRGQSLDRNTADVTRVREIMNRLVAQARVFRSDAPAWPWEMHIIDSRAVNAWAMPGGKMAIYTGFLERIQPTDDELAALIGHEVTHALREHSRERISERLGTSLLLDVAVSVLDIEEDQAQLAELIMEVAFTLPNSRSHEREADCIGVELAARAGFNPVGAVTLWQKMARQGTGSTPEFLSTHPSPANRIRDLSRYAQRLNPLYQSSRTRLAQRTAPAQPSPRPRTEPVRSQGPSPNRAARLTVASRPLATIFVNGKKVPSNPLVNYTVPAGPVELRFEVTDTAGTWTQELTVTLSPGEQRNLGRVSLMPPQPEPVANAYLTLGTQPLATIFLNGERAPSNPLVNFAVPAGPVRLRFEVTDTTGTWTQELTFTLSPSERRNLGRILLVRP